MSDFIPKFFTTFKDGYGANSFKSDLIAGLTVAIVALPLSMALAIASGASPDKGLITAVIAGFFISFLGGSRIQVGGPTGAFVVVIFGVIAKHGYDGLILATLMAGIILVVSGYARLGQIIKYIPYPVVTGFTSGIAVIIASTQVKDFLGLKIDKVPAEFLHKWESYFEHINTADSNTIIIGVLSLSIIILIKKFLPKLPGYLIAVVVASLAAFYFKLPVETIGSRFPNISSGFAMPSLPDFSIMKAREVLPASFVIAFLAGIEALLSAVVADGMTGYKHNSNQELVGQGFANIASALFMGLPATGAIARTATNIKAGGKTPVAGIIHALFVLIFMMFAMNIVAYIPMAALAAILFMVAWGMSEIHNFIHLFKLSTDERNTLIITFLLTVFVDLTVAIGVGVTLASLLFMKQMGKYVEISKHGDVILANIDLSADEVNIEDEDKQRSNLPEGVEVFRIAGPVFFGVAGELADTLNLIGRTPKVLIIRMKLVPYIDATAMASIRKIVDDCRSRKIKIIFSALKPQPRKMLSKGKILSGDDSIMTAINYNKALKLAEENI